MQIAELGYELARMGRLQHMTSQLATANTGGMQSPMLVVCNVLYTTLHTTGSDSLQS